MKNRKAIIPAAGLGTLFLPATKAQPMELLLIVDKPTIQYIVVFEYLKDFYEKAQGESLKRGGT
jgi:UTP-glucose-1-phosphate uridylyltransferase